MGDKIRYQYKFFLFFSLFWIIIGWGLFLFSLLGIFYWWSISLLLALVTAGSARFILKNLIKTPPHFLIINLILIIIAIVFSFFSSPTVFSGRDQASISQAAIHLSQNGKLAFSNSVSEDFFKINYSKKDSFTKCLNDKLSDSPAASLKSKLYQTYCQVTASAKAYNFPGFYYTTSGELITQFPIVYTAWLAMFYSFLGLLGFTLANGILFYSFLLAFYLLIFKFTQTHTKTNLATPFLGLLIVATSFCFMWFTKFTLTENMATPLLWTGILALTLLTGSKIENLNNKKITLAVIFLSLGLLIFTRIEGIAFFALAILSLFLYKNTRQYFKDNFLKIFLPLFIFILLIFIWNLFVDIYFYKSIFKATIENIQEDSNNVSQFINFSPFLNLIKIFFLYGLFFPILFGTTGILYLIKKKDYKKLLPLLIALPSLFYLFSPQITNDHPWMLRRFTFSILPLFIFYSIILINNFNKKKNIVFGIILAIVILAFNSIPFSKYLTFTPTNNLLAETSTLSQNFSNEDLILVDQMASGDNFEMLDQPLTSIFGKNAVYFFNPSDLNSIDETKYARIYLIVPSSRIDYYKKTSLAPNMELVKDYSLNSAELIYDKKYTLPIRNTRIITGSIFEILK